MTMKIAAAAYAAAAARAGAPAAPEATGTTASTGFADLVRDAAGDAVDTLKKSEALSIEAVAGKADLGEVVTAVANAEATLQTVAALRDRVVAAYQEILRMPI